MYIPASLVLSVIFTSTDIGSSVDTGTLAMFSSLILSSTSLRLQVMIVGGRMVALKLIVNTGGSASRDDNKVNMALPLTSVAPVCNIIIIIIINYYNYYTFIIIMEQRTHLLD